MIKSDKLNTFIQKLDKAARKNESILCLGIDPDITKIDTALQSAGIKANSIGEKLSKFFTSILDITENSKAGVGCVKPNYAFFAQYGFDGLHALKDIISYAKKSGHVILLDAKRGDIGKTSYAYAKEAFEFWQADAVTVSPYMGMDSVMPFVENPEYGAYVLTRTSNPGAKDFQDLQVSYISNQQISHQKMENKRVYESVAQNVVQWSKKSGKNNVCSVVGGTYLSELDRISAIYSSCSPSGQQIPMLIPGIGNQGGSAAETVKVLMKHYDSIAIHRINSSSGITYAFEKVDKTGKTNTSSSNKSANYIDAAEKAIIELNKEIKQAGGKI